MMAYAGKVNKLIVERLQSLGVNAVGLSGLDGRLLEGKRKAAIRIIEDGKQKVLRDDWTGTIERVNAGLLTILLDAGYLPVVAPLASSNDGEALNVDGDRAAAALAVGLGADTLLLLSNVPGLLRAFPDESSADPADRARRGRGVSAGGAGAHEEEGAWRGRGARRRRGPRHPGRCAQRPADQPRAGGAGDGDLVIADWDA